MDAPQPCSGDAFGLASPDVFPLVLGHEREHLQHEVGNEGPQQVPVPPGIQQRHVQYKDVHMQFLREQPSLPLYFLIIAAQTIDARDAELVAGPEPCQQVFVPGTAEVLARHPVGEDPVPGDALPLQGQMLALRVLVGAGYTGVTVHAVHGMLLGMAGRPGSQPVVPRPAGACPFSGTLRRGYAIRRGGGSHAGVLPEMGRGAGTGCKKTRFFHLFCRQMEKACFFCHVI